MWSLELTVPLSPPHPHDSLTREGTPVLFLHRQQQCPPEDRESLVRASEAEGLCWDWHQGLPCCRLQDLELLTTVLAALGWAWTPTLPHALLRDLADLTRVRQQPGADWASVASLLGETWTRLRPFQQVAVHRAVSWGQLALMDEMGCGKTVETLAALAFWFRQKPTFRAIILCPRSLCYNWRAESEKWLPEELHRSIRVVLKGDQFIPTLQESAVSLIITTHDLPNVRPARKTSRKKPRANPRTEALRIWNPDCVVVDEAHKLKHLHTQRTQSLLPLLRRAPKKLLLTGTPANRHSEFWLYVHLLAPDLFSTFHSPASTQYDFAGLFCRPTKSHFPPHVWEYKGNERPVLLSAILSQVRLRRTKAEVLPFLPDKHRQVRRLGPLAAADQRQIEKLLAQNADPTGNAAARYAFTQAYTVTSRAKQSLVVDYLRDTLLSDEGTVVEPCLIFVHHRTMRESIIALLEQHHVPYFTIHQGVSAQIRQNGVEAFQEGHLQVAVLSIQAASAGLTLTRATRVIFAELRFGPDDIRQSEDRAHRIGQERAVTVTYLLATGSVDEICYNLMLKKERVVQACLLDPNLASPAVPSRPWKRHKTAVVDAQSLMQ